MLEYTGPGSDEEDSSTKAPPMSFGVVVDLRELRIGRPTEQNPVGPSESLSLILTSVGKYMHPTAVGQSHVAFG